MKFETPLDIFVLFIVLIKIVFVLSAIGHLVFSHTSNTDLQKKDPELVYWKERTEFIFVVSMSVLLIYHFKPGNNKQVSEETALLFFLFGIILLLTSKWSLFVKEAPWYKRIVSELK
jgi:cell division protein FtsW (lipid II flippase)